MASRQPIPPFISTQADKRSGIYAIVCTINGKIYIGGSVNIWARWLAHKSWLGLRNTQNQRLQQAWNEHGEDAFEWGVLEYCPKSKLLAREKYYLDLTRSYDELYGFNVRRIPYPPQPAPQDHSRGKTALLLIGIAQADRDRLNRIANHLSQLDGRPSNKARAMHWALAELEAQLEAGQPLVAPPE